MATPLMALKSRPRWGQKQRDTSFVDAEARDRLAEARRRRFAVMMDKSKHKKGGDKDHGDHGGSDFDEGRWCDSVVVVVLMVVVVGVVLLMVVVVGVVLMMVVVVVGVVMMVVVVVMVVVVFLLLVLVS